MVSRGELLIGKEKLRSLYDITDWGKDTMMQLLMDGANLEQREAFWEDYHDRIIEWAVKLNGSV